MVPRQAAPLGLRLPYCRAKGEAPDGPTRILDAVTAGGWSLDILHDPGAGFSAGTSSVRFGDLLLELAVARALSDATAGVGGRTPELVYRGPRHRLMRRSDLPFAACEPGAEHTVFTAGHPSPVTVEVRPNRPPIWPAADAEDPAERLKAHVPPWLDVIGDEVEVHSGLPMRYYLEIEQQLGVRLPVDLAPAPRYRSAATSADPRHVALIATTSAHGSRQDYGVEGLLGIARALLGIDPSGWRFTLVTNDEAHRGAGADLGRPLDVVVRPDELECLDLFGGCALVVGNDTGLTHLAALTVRPDGTGPQVIALHGRYSHLKWVTGSPRHHSVATPLSQMMAFADIGLYINSYGRPIDDTLWGTSDVCDIPPALVAGFAHARLTQQSE